MRSTCGSSSSTASAQRVSLGLKQLGADPWQNIARRYPPNTRLFGKVTNIADYGCFVEIEEGVEGLVHVSEMDWTNKNVNPAKVVHVGQEVEVMVLDIDEERRRISLGVKQCKANPWKEFAENYNRGDKVGGQIKSITDFGIFIGLPAASTAWCTCRTSPGTCPARRRCAATRRASRSRPWCCRSIRSASASARHQAAREGSVLGLHRRASRRAASSSGVVRKWTRGRDHRSRQRHRRPAARLGTRARPRRGCALLLKVGEEVEAKFTGVDRKTRSISLSIKAKDIHEEQRRCRTIAPIRRPGTSLGICSKRQISGQD
jgi:small subunit ribosomal protein S1